MFNRSRGSVDGTTIPSKRKRHPFRWIAFVFLMLCVPVYFPSVSSLVFLAAAILVCPIRRIRELDFVQRMEDTIASLGIPVNLAINIAATFLFIIGAIVAPNTTNATRSAPKMSNNELISVTGDIEYSHNPVNVFDYIVCSDKNAKLEVTDDVVASRVGSQFVTFKITRNIFSHSEEDVELTVRDTQVPVIEFAEDSVEVMMGDSINPSSNVRAVTDPVDGELVEVEEEPDERRGRVGLDRLYDEGWYLVKNADTSKAGVQEITVWAADQHGNEAEATYDLVVVDPFEGVHFNKTTSELEYSNKQLDPTKLIKCSDPEVTFTADKISLDKVGDIKVTYTLKKGNATKKEVRTFHIRDTKGPRIAIGQDELSIEQGESFDPYANVASVEDEVDGALERAEAEREDGGEGWYTVEGSYDVNTPSKYYFTVIACDRNGNRATREFSLRVKDPPVQEPVQEYTAPVYTYVLNTRSDVFHYPNCPSVKQMSDANKQIVDATRDDVISWGYKSCGRCNP